MSLFLYLLSLILCVGLLWIAGKFFGHIGLILFAIVETVLLFFVGQYPIAIFGVHFPLLSVHFVAIIYFTFYFYNQYSEKECVKLLTTLAGALVYIGLTMFVIYSFAMSMSYGWEGALSHLLIWILTFGVTLGVGYVMQRFVKTIKNAEITSLINMATALSAGSVVFIMVTGIGVVGFGTMLLQMLFTIIFSLITLAIIFFFDKFLLFVRDEKEPEKGFGKTMKKIFATSEKNNAENQENAKKPLEKKQKSLENNQQSSENKNNESKKNAEEQEKQEEQEDPEMLKKYFVDEDEDEETSLSEDVEAGINAEANSKRKKF